MGATMTAAEPEPVLDLAEIQGNVVAGFKQDFQTLRFVHIDDPEAFKGALAKLAARVATAEAVHTFNLLYKQLGDTKSVKSTWLNIAFSFDGIKKLITPARDEVYFVDDFFRNGAAAMANSRKWKVSDGPGAAAADVLIIVAADAEADVDAELKTVMDLLDEHGGATVLEHVDRGENLGGREHFGYRDGISQPGIRGYADPDSKVFLTPRDNPRDPDQGKPGQELLWPGIVVFGYQGQVGSRNGVCSGGDSRYDGVGRLQVPEKLGRNGAYLVFRRFKQDVHAFHQHLQDEASGEPPVKVGARIVGRWPSGAPIMRVPNADYAPLGQDDSANNYFVYRVGTPPNARSRQDLGPPPGFPLAEPDPDGKVCPHTAHIRRANPRDDLSDKERREHRMVRRGIPYGPLSASTPDHPAKDEEDRGLLFLAYMTSISRQFEFVNNGWADPGGTSLLGGNHSGCVSLGR